MSKARKAARVYLVERVAYRAWDYNGLHYSQCSSDEGDSYTPVRAFADKAQSATARNLAKGFYLLLPDLELLNLKSHASNELAVAASYVWSAAGYGIAYSAVVLALAVLVLSRRDLN